MNRSFTWSKSLKDFGRYQDVYCRSRPVWELRLADRALGTDSCHYRGEEALNMLVVTDFGCDLHLPRRFKYFGPEAQMLREVIANLPADGEDHAYICKHGHSHRLMVEVQMPEGSIAGVRELNSHS